MKILGKLLGLVLLLGLAGLFVYLLYRFVLPLWVPILFWGYCLAGAIFAVFYSIGMRSAKKQSDFQFKLLRKFQKAKKEKTLGTKIEVARESLTSFISIFVPILLWPVTLTITVRNLPAMKALKSLEDIQEWSLGSEAQVPEFVLSLYALIVELCVLGLHFTRVNTGLYGEATLVLMIATVSLRHTSYITSTTSLPAQLRRRSENPYASFLLLAVLDFAALVIGVTTLSLPPKRANITPDIFVRVGRELLESEGSIWKLLKGGTPSAFEVIVAIITLLFGLAILNVLREFKEFKRTDEDYVWLAAVDDRLGRFSSALRHLGNLKSWNTEARACEITALVGVNEIERAAEKSRLFLEFQGKATDPVWVYREMVGAFRLFKLPSRAFVSLQDWGIAHQIPDPLMAETVQQSENRGIEAELAGRYQKIADKYPLSAAQAYLLIHQPAEAHRVLAAAGPPTGVEQLVSRKISVLVQLAEDPDISDEDAQKALRGCIDDSVPIVRELMASTNQTLDRLLIFDELVILREWATLCEPDRLEELNFLLDKIKLQTTDTDAAKQMEVIDALLVEPDGS